MSVRKTSFVPGEFYHLYNRGNSKQKIFHDPTDYYRFIVLLYTCNSENNFRIFLLNQKFDADPYLFERGDQLVSIGAYCLMPNHFHLLISEKKAGGISKFMQKFSTAYVMYYNNKYERTGGLFEGKFRSEHLYNDEYLKYIFSYIHLNPLKLIQNDWREKGLADVKGALNYLRDYEYSSYLDFKGFTRKQNSILEKGAYPDYFPNISDFDSEIMSWISSSLKPC